MIPEKARLIAVMAPDFLSTFIRKIAPKIMQIVSNALKNPDRDRAMTSFPPISHTNIPSRQVISHESGMTRFAGHPGPSIRNTVRMIGNAAIKA